MSENDKIETVSERSDRAQAPHAYLLYVYFAFMCLFISSMCILMHYGVLSPREDTSLSMEELYITAMCASDVTLILILRYYLRMIPSLSDAIKKILAYVLLALLAINIFVIVDIGKSPEKSWADILIILGIGILCIFLYVIFLYHKSPKTKLSIADKLDGMAKKSEEKLNQQWREREAKSMRGEANPGYADLVGDKISIHTNVKAQTTEFCVLFSTFTAMFLIAKICHNDEDVVGGMAVLAYAVGCILFNIHVYSYINTAVCKGGIPYKIGAKYALIAMLIFSTACALIVHVMMPGWEFDPIGDLFILAEIPPMFIILLLLCVFNSKKDGKWSLFDIDGYKKRTKG